VGFWIQDGEVHGVEWGLNYKQKRAWLSEELKTYKDVAEVRGKCWLKSNRDTTGFLWSGWREFWSRKRKLQEEKFNYGEKRDKRRKGKDLKFSGACRQNEKEQ